MSAQNTLVLGTPTVDFDPTKLQLMLNRAKTVDDLKAVKEYIVNYFARSDDPVATWMWRPSDHTFKVFEDADVKSRHIYKDKVMITLEKASVWRLIFSNGSSNNIGFYIK